MTDLRYIVRKYLENTVSLTLAAVLLVSGSPFVAFDVAAAPQSKTQAAKVKKKTGGSTARTSKAASKSSRKGTSKGASKGKVDNSPKNKGKVSSKRESAADLKKRQNDAQQEVKKTREELLRNEAEVKKGLSELSRLEGDIAVSRKETAALGAEVRKLDGTINTLNGKIAGHSAELDRLRSEYLKAIKKTRTSRKTHSTLAYVFGAKNLAQADRRMRYLKQFSEWKDRRTKDINDKVALLRKEQAQLQRAKSDKDVMLGRELKAQARLTEQKERQDALVVSLKANGEALQSHLAKKQAEVNQLRNQVAALIAEEQRRAEAQRREEERRQREAEQREAARLAEQERMAEERAEKERAEKAAAEAAATEKDEQSKVSEKTTKGGDKTSSRSAKKAAEKAKKEAEKAKKAAAEKAKKEAAGKAKKEAAKKENAKSDAKDYASARKRRPRSDAASGAASKSGGSSAPSSKSTVSRNTGADFATMKGSLPRPVSGAFRITSPFGKHSLPDLPDVTYDNPGIDAEVSAGASALAVHGGTVSGVYMIPGFSTVVIVNHGEYYTVYGNIARAAVKVGDRVSQGQKVGSLADDPDSPGHSQIHFEVWKGREKLNPASWIR